MKNNIELMGDEKPNCTVLDKSDKSKSIDGLANTFNKYINSTFGDRLSMIARKGLDNFKELNSFTLNREKYIIDKIEIINKVIAQIKTFIEKETNKSDGFKNSDQINKGNDFITDLECTKHNIVYNETQNSTLYNRYKSMRKSMRKQTPSASAYGVQSLTFASGYGSLQNT